MCNNNNNNNNNKLLANPTQMQPSVRDLQYGPHNTCITIQMLVLHEK
jgi:hypothetical protein